MDIGPSPLKRHRLTDAPSDVEELQGVQGAAASPRAPSASPPQATSLELGLRKHQTMPVGEEEAGAASRGGSTERQVVEGGGASNDAAAVVTGKCSPWLLCTAGGVAIVVMQLLQLSFSLQVRLRLCILQEPQAQARTPYTDATKAFRELRVRPALSDNAGGPPSPKKRKASNIMDKEFILQDEKVKRSTTNQGDIAAARGMLGALLFEFSQIELNRDLLEAIKRTESKTGRLGRAASSSRLDRAAFERVVAETSELLQSQLATVEAHTGSVAQRSAILRAYAVQAIAAFANEDESESEEEEEEEGATAQLPQGKQQQEQQEQPGRQERLTALALTPAGPEGSSSEEDLEEDDVEHPGPLRRPRSAAALYSPGRGLHPHPPPGGTAGSVSALGGEQVSSSVLPDAPPESALEDTAAMSMPQQQQQPPQVARQGSSQHLQAQEQARSGAQVFSGGKEEGAAGSEMRGALSGRGASSGHDATMGQPSGQTSGDGPVDMVRSPAPVDSRPEPPSLERLRLAAAGGSPRQQQQQQHQQGQEQEQDPREMGQLLDAAAPLTATAAHPPRPSGHGQFKREASGVAGADSSGRASSDAAAGEQPKRQRKAGSSGGAGALGLLLQRRQGLAELAPTPSGPEDDELERGQGATSGFRRARPQSQQDRVDVGNKAAATAAAAASAEPGGGSKAEDGGDAEPAQEQQEPNSSDGTRRAAGRSAALLQPQGAASGSSVWGSTLVCADLTVDDVASAYWPFLRSAMKGEAPPLHKDDEALIASLVGALGESIAASYSSAAAGGSSGGGTGARAAVAHSSARPTPDLKSLVAATAFDDLYRDRHAAESSGGS